MKPPNGQLTPLLIPRHTAYNKLFALKVDRQVMVNGECHWQLGKPKWETVYHRSILSKDGDVAWRILHNRIITSQQVQKWGKRDTTDIMDHMFFKCPTATAFWVRLTKMLHGLLGPRPLQKRHILYGNTNLDTTPQQLANYLLILAKNMIYVPGNEQHPPTTA
jgi:hypothetical protein